VLLENARREPMVYAQALFELRSADWQLCRIECMLQCVTEYFAASNREARRSDSVPNFWRKHGKLAQYLHATAWGSIDPLVYTATRSATACSPHLASLNHVSVLQEQSAQLVAVGEERPHNEQQRGHFLAFAVHRQEPTRPCFGWPSVWGPDEMYR
jgi:hypothetical protein